MMAVVTGLIALQADFLVGSIGAFTANLGISETFAAVILVPIAEHGSAIVVRRMVSVRVL